MNRWGLFGALVLIGLGTFAIAPMFSDPPPVPDRKPAGTARGAEPRPVEVPTRPNAVEGGEDRRAEVPPAKAKPADPAPAAKVEPTRRDGDTPPALVGLEVEDATPSELAELKVPEGQTGVVIRFVDPGSSAAEAALAKGDVIVRAQRTKISTKDSLVAAVQDREQTLLTVYRDGFPFQVVLHKPFVGDRAER